MPDSGKKTPYYLNRETAFALTFPLKGEWTAINTPGERIPSHGTYFLAQAYAYDFSLLNEGGSPLPRRAAVAYLLRSVPPESFFAWRSPILSPISGRVVDVAINSRDKRPSFIQDMIKMKLMSRLGRGGGPSIFGNYITIEHDDRFIVMAHLHHSSILVSLGDEVREAEKIGEVGNSGNASIPHLHLQVMDRSSALGAVAVPCRFTAIEVLEGGKWHLSATGIPRKYQRVRTILKPELVRGTDAV